MYHWLTQNKARGFIKYMHTSIISVSYTGQCGVFGSKDYQYEYLLLFREMRFLEIQANSILDKSLRYEAAPVSNTRRE